MQGLWQEFDHYQCIQMECNADIVTLKRFVEKDRTFEFFAGLNVKFDAVGDQILGKENLSSLNETIFIVRAKEGRRSVMLEIYDRDSSALLTKTTSLKQYVPHTLMKELINK